MKLMITFLMILFSGSLMSSEFSSIEKKAFSIKEKLNFHQYLLKLEAEKELMKLESKTTDSLDNMLFDPIGIAMPGSILKECADWVYKGPGSMEDAIRSCKRVKSMECVKWVYQGPGDRHHAARACKGVYLQECAEFVYRGPGSKADAAKACRGVHDMQCVEELYRGPHSRKEAAKLCSEGGRPPGAC